MLECNDYEKELRVHDWICRNIEYDYEGADKDKVSRVIASHNILGVFAHHKAQCEGIAKAVKVLLNAVDVKCIVVTGDSIKSGQCVPHAWNIVDIDGEPYQLDVTWDVGTAKSRKIIYDYFNLTDSLINLEHRAENILPKCNKVVRIILLKLSVIFILVMDYQNIYRSRLNKEKKRFSFE